MNNEPDANLYVAIIKLPSSQKTVIRRIIAWTGDSDQGVPQDVGLLKKNPRCSWMEKAITDHLKICQETKVKPFPVPSNAQPLQDVEAYWCVKCLKFMAHHREIFNRHMKSCLQTRNFNCIACKVWSSPMKTAGRTGNKSVSSKYLSVAL